MNLYDRVKKIKDEKEKEKLAEQKRKESAEQEWEATSITRAKMTLKRLKPG